MARTIDASTVETLAECLRNVEANLTGRDCFAERIADSLRRIKIALANLELPREEDVKYNAEAVNKLIGSHRLERFISQMPTTMQFLLTTRLATINCGSLAALDAAFVEAAAKHRNVAAETYKMVNGQAVGRTHAYKLDDGRIFRRPLANWETAELVESR